MVAEEAEVAVVGMVEVEETINCHPGFRWFRNPSNQNEMVVKDIVDEMTDLVVLQLIHTAIVIASRIIAQKPIWAPCPPGQIDILGGIVTMDGTAVVAMMTGAVSTGKNTILTIE
jgi:hypothetical protein